MDKKCNISVIGTGVLSLSIAGQMSARGGKVTFIDTNSRGNGINTAHKLIFRGAVELVSEIIDFTDDYDSLKYADVVAVTISPSDFSCVFDRMLPNITSGQKIIFFPGSYGALLFKKRLEEETDLIDICLSESVSYPYVTELQDFRTIYVHSVKRELKLASCPYRKNQDLCDFYNGFFNIFTPAQSFLETSLENINSVLHPLPILLNIGMLEKEGKSFRHFIDGVSPVIGSLMEQMDEERLALGTAYGTTLISSLKQLNSYYGKSSAESLFEYLAGKDSPYKNINGFGMNSRYIVEDIPYLVVPAASLGRAAHVKMPVYEVVINLASIISKEDFNNNGFTIDRLGLQGKSVREIQKALCDFR